MWDSSRIAVLTLDAKTLRVSPAATQSSLKDKSTGSRGQASGCCVECGSERGSEGRRGTEREGGRRQGRERESERARERGRKEEGTNERERGETDNERVVVGRGWQRESVCVMMRKREREREKDS
eukprot:1717226-Rhodomonas_salina.1